MRLRGIVDIFRATALLESARKALSDDKAASIRLDMADVERMDVSAAQNLLALKTLKPSDAN